MIPADFRLQWRQGHIHDALMARLFFLFGEVTPQGKKETKLLEQFRLQSLSMDLIDLANISLELVQKIRFRKISPEIPCCLIAWDRGDRPLKLVEFIPSSQRMLDLQCSGFRFVSVLAPEKHPRPLQFFLHDLHHAEKFFNAKNISTDEQINLYHCWQELMKEDLIQTMYKNDPEFHQQFDYLIADMNTHPVHQIKYCKAIFCFAHKRLMGNIAADETWTDLWRKLTKDIDRSTQMALLHLNTEKETEQDHQILQKLKANRTC